MSCTIRCVCWCEYLLQNTDTAALKSQDQKSTPLTPGNRAAVRVLSLEFSWSEKGDAQKRDLPSLPDTLISEYPPLAINIEYKIDIIGYIICLPFDYLFSNQPVFSVALFNDYRLNIAHVLRYLWQVVCESRI
jgi:hypothetical protein